MPGAVVLLMRGCLAAWTWVDVRGKRQKEEKTDQMISIRKEYIKNNHYPGSPVGAGDVAGTGDLRWLPVVSARLVRRWLHALELRT